MINTNFFQVVAENAGPELTMLIATKEGLASFFGSMTRRVAENLYVQFSKNPVTSAQAAIGLLEELKQAGYAKPSGDEIQILEDSIAVKLYNFLWAIALIGRCANAEAFANRVLGKQPTSTQVGKKIDNVKSFLVANMPKSEQLDTAIEALDAVKAHAKFVLPEKVNRAYTTEQRNASKVLKSRIVKTTATEALSPERELANVEALKIINKSF